MADIDTLDADAPGAAVQTSAAELAPLFEPFHCGTLELANRIVMAPMTRWLSPGGVPGPDVAAYYRRRAESGVGLIFTEGTWIPHAGAHNGPNAPDFYGEEALAGWKHVCDEVHRVGGKIIPQLWHVGLFIKGQPSEEFLTDYLADPRYVGPSGVIGAMSTTIGARTRGVTQKDIDELIEAYATAAVTAQRLGFDGIAVHAAHGYLIDQFFWEGTNQRDDAYGGGLVQRTRFGAEIVAEIRRRVGPDFPVVIRISQWKQHDYKARLAHTPELLADFLAPLIDAGVDIFDCSQRRFWETEFEGSDMNFAGWVKKLSGRPTVTVGSITLNQEFLTTAVRGVSAEVVGLGRLVEMLERGDFDLAAVGRAILVDPHWVEKVRRGALDELLPYTPEAMKTLS